MKITDLKAVYPNYRNVPPSWRTNLWQIVVRVESDDGTVGHGYGGGGRAAVEVVNGHMRDLLVGRTVEGVEDIFAAWDALYYESMPYGRKGIGVMALSGIDSRCGTCWQGARMPLCTRSLGRGRRRGLIRMQPEWMRSGTRNSGSGRTSSRIVTRAALRMAMAQNEPLRERVG